MNILLVLSSLGMGGAERVASTLSNAWAARGEVVTLVPTYSKRCEPFYFISEKVRVVHLADVARSSVPLFHYWSRFQAFRRIVFDVKPDVVVSLLTKVNIAVLFACHRMNVPVIACERINPMAETESSAGLKALRRLTYPSAAAVTVQTEDIVLPFRAMCPGVRAIKVVPNPLPPGIDAYQHAKAPRSRKRIAAMGRFTEQKRFALLIAIFSRVASVHTDWDLWIWGDGPLERDLRNQVKHLGLEGRVFLPGRTTSPWAELATSDVYASTSAFEGFPNALMEAMAIGLPCISFDCPSGPRDLSRGGRDACLVPNGDVLGFTTQLDALLSNPALREELGARASRSVRERFSLSTVLSVWDDVFRMIGRDPDTHALMKKEGSA